MATICELFNKCWKSGDIPHIWKLATICPLPKGKKDLTQPKSHRPVSLTSGLIKWMERVILARLISFLDKKHKRATEQAGARIKHQTADLLASLEQTIEEGFDQKKDTLAVFIDLTQAYDCARHNDIIHKCIEVGINGKMIGWLHNYLSGRQIQTRVGNSFSHKAQLKIGIPQGGCLSPLLFTLLMDELTEKHYLPKDANIGIFVDDVAYWTTNRNIKKSTKIINKCLQGLKKWCEKTGFIVSLEKTVAIRFSLKHRRTLERNQPVLKYGEHQLELKDSARYLGAIFDRKLKWKEQVNNVLKQANMRMGILRRLSSSQASLNSQQKRSLYVATVQSVLDYASPVWSHSLDKATHLKLTRLQNQALRLITGTPTNTSAEALRTLTDILPVRDRHRLQSATFYERTMRLPKHHMGKRLLQQQQDRRSAVPTKRLKRQSCLEAGSTSSSDICSDINQLSRLEIPTSPVDPLDLDPPYLAINLPGCQSQYEIDTRYPAPEHLHIYTDGSLNPKQKTAGIGISFYYQGRPCNFEQSLVENYRWKICDIELKAMNLALKALQYNRQDIKLRGEYSSVVILSDSLSAIHKIKSATEYTFPPENLVKDFLTTAKDFISHMKGIGQITLQWVPGHRREIPGNEKADELARQGAQLPTRTFSLHYEASKHILEQSLRQSRKDFIRINGTPSARMILRFKTKKFTKDEIHKLPWEQQRMIYLLRTNRFPTAKYLHVINKSPNDQCTCGEIESVHHMLTDCPRTHATRVSIWTETDPGIRKLLYGSIGDLCNTLKFLKITGRLQYFQ